MVVAHQHQFCLFTYGRRLTHRIAILLFSQPRLHRWAVEHCWLSGVLTHRDVMEMSFRRVCCSAENQVVADASQRILLFFEVVVTAVGLLGLCRRHRVHGFLLTRQSKVVLSFKFPVPLLLFCNRFNLRELLVQPPLSDSLEFVHILG